MALGVCYCRVLGVGGLMSEVPLYLIHGADAVDAEELLGDDAVSKLEPFLLAFGVAPQLVYPRLPDFLHLLSRQRAEIPCGVLVVGYEDGSPPLWADKVRRASLLWVEFPAEIPRDILWLGGGCVEDWHLVWGLGIRVQDLRIQGL